MRSALLMIHMSWCFMTNITPPSTAIASTSNWTNGNAYCSSMCGSLFKTILRLITMQHIKTNILLALCSICMPSPVLSAATDWFYLNYGAGTPVRCHPTNPGFLQCASDNNADCKWGQYPAVTSMQPVPGVTAADPYTVACPWVLSNWLSAEGLSACHVLGCSEGYHWYYSDSGAGTPVRCSPIPNKLECASLDHSACQWGTFSAGWSFGQQMTGVSGIWPATSDCPGWPASQDSCEVLGCYSASPTTYPTVSPTSDTTSPSQAPTAKLEWCVDRSIIDGWYDGDSIDIANNVWTDKSVNNNDGSISVSTGIGVSDGTTESHELFTYLNKIAVYGDTTTEITFTDLQIDHTVFNYCKYRDSGAKGRILNAYPENGLFGFHQGKSGMAYEMGWISNNTIDHFGSAWVISSQQPGLYRGNRIDLTINPSATFTQINQLNIGLNAEDSDWACTE
eukprot:579937_1